MLWARNDVIFAGLVISSGQHREIRRQCLALLATTSYPKRLFTGDPLTSINGAFTLTLPASARWSADTMSERFLPVPFARSSIRRRAHHNQSQVLAACFISASRIGVRAARCA
jgi:hypothetical protein